MVKALTISVLSCKDILHEWRMSFCVMFAVTAIATPLLIFFGLKSGIMETLRTRLLSNPATMEIISVNENRYDNEWFENKRKDPLVSFVIPRTRRLAASAEFQVTGGKHKKSLDLYPTSAGDPLLIHYGVRIPDFDSCVLTQEAARRIQAQKGDRVFITVSRDQGKIRENRELTVVGILPDAAGMVAAAYIDLRFLEQVEGFKDGMAVPELGWKGIDSKAFPVVPEAILVTDRKLDSVREAMLVQNTGFIRIENVFAPEESENSKVSDIHPLLDRHHYIYVLNTVGMPAKKDDLAMLSDKLRGRGDSWVIPANPYLTLYVSGKEFNLSSLTAFRKPLPQPVIITEPVHEEVPSHSEDSVSFDDTEISGNSTTLTETNSPVTDKESEINNTGGNLADSDNHADISSQTDDIVKSSGESDGGTGADQTTDSDEDSSEKSFMEHFYDEDIKNSEAETKSERSYSENDSMKTDNSPALTDSVGFEEEEELLDTAQELKITLPKSSEISGDVVSSSDNTGSDNVSDEDNSVISVYDSSLCTGKDKICDFGKEAMERQFFASPEVVESLPGKHIRVKVTYFNYDKTDKSAGDQERAVEFSASFKALPELKNSDVLLVSPSLLGQLGLLSQRELSDGTDSGGNKAFLLKRKGYTGFRMYATSLDDVIVLQEKLSSEGIKTVSKADRISEILTLDRYLSLLFWMIAAASISGAACCLIANVYANVERKRKELAILRLLGVHGGHLCIYPLVCSVMLTSGGILISFGVYAGLAYAVNDSFSYQLQGTEKFCHLDYAHFAATYMIAFGVAMLSGLVASRKVMNIDPSESLRDE